MIDRTFINFGMSDSEFRSEYLERKAVLFCSATERYPDATSDFARALCASDHADGRVNVFVNGAPLPYDMFTETYQDISDARRRISMPQLESFLGMGATVAVNRIDRQMPYARTVCDLIQSFAHEAATANCYAAVSGRGSFGAHWDTHDVIALQISGKKHWRVWGPTHYLPVPGQGSRGKSRDLHAPPVIDTVLVSGDALYIPRGWWHEASPIQGFPTIHLAIGLRASTVDDYISWLAENVLINQPQLRRGFSRAIGDMDKFSSSIDTVRSVLLDPKSIAEYTKLHDNMLSSVQRNFNSTLGCNDT